MKLPRQPEPGPNRRRYGPALSLGTNIAGGMLGLTFVGYSIDRRLGEGEGETFTLIGLFLGLIYSGYEVWKVVKFLQRQEKSEEDSEPLDSARGRPKKPET